MTTYVKIKPDYRFSSAEWQEWWEQAGNIRIVDYIAQLKEYTVFYKEHPPTLLDGTVCPVDVRDVQYETKFLIYAHNGDLYNMMRVLKKYKKTIYKIMENFEESMEDETIPFQTPSEYFRIVKLVDLMPDDGDNIITLNEYAYKEIYDKYCDIIKYFDSLIEEQLEVIARKMESGEFAHWDTNFTKEEFESHLYQ